MMSILLWRAGDSCYTDSARPNLFYATIAPGRIWGCEQAARLLYLHTRELPTKPLTGLRISFRRNSREQACSISQASVMVVMVAAFAYYLLRGAEVFQRLEFQ